MVGDGGVGKTCLATVLAKGRFPSGAYVPTTFDAHTVALALSPGTFVEISLWDCAGQPEFDQVRHYAYFPTLDVFVLCFSLADRRSLEHCERRWQREMRDFDADVPVILVGTKADLRDGGGSARGAVSSREGREMASRIGAARYVEVSSKAGRNVTSVFEAAAELALRRRKGTRAAAAEDGEGEDTTNGSSRSGSSSDSDVYEDAGHGGKAAETAASTALRSPRRRRQYLPQRRRRRRHRRAASANGDRYRRDRETGEPRTESGCGGCLVQ